MKRAGIATWLAITVLCSWSQRALAQRAAELPEDILPLSEFDDPIGVDQDSRGLQNVAAERARSERLALRNAAADSTRHGPEPPPLSVRNGEVLTAVPAIRETAHRVAVRLEPGRARVQVRIELQSQAMRPSEARYRLSLPANARVLGLEVCNDAGCREAEPEQRPELRAYDASVLARPVAGTRSLPVARAVAIRDDRGAALLVFAAPVADSSPLRLRVEYVAEAKVHGGTVRFTLPARGMDPQLAPAEVSLAVHELREARMGTSAQASTRVDPWTELPVHARVPAAAGLRAVASHERCGTAWCAGVALWAGMRRAEPVDLVIALDVSPSTEGPARGRLIASVSALLAAAPEGSRVRALAFAGRSSALFDGARDAREVPLAPFAQAIAEAELGSATRFEAVWELAKPWLASARAERLRPMIAIVGDGGLTRGNARPFEQAGAAGIEVVAINASDLATSEALRRGTGQCGGVALAVGAEAEVAARRGDGQALEARLAALFAPTVSRNVTLHDGRKRIALGPLRAGEALLWQGRAVQPVIVAYAGGQLRSTARSSANPDVVAGGVADHPTWIAVDRRDLAPSDNWPPPQTSHGPCERRGPPTRFGGVNSDAQPLALAEERSCRAPVATATSPDSSGLGAGMPSEPLLEMLRQRILPVARGCFRRDRAGQLRYEKRASFLFELAEREVTSAHIEGAIPATLRRCLLQAVDQLEVPRFTGVVKVRYPLITESVPTPSQIELRPVTSGVLDRLFGDPVPATLDASGSALHTPPAPNVHGVRR